MVVYRKVLCGIARMKTWCPSLAAARSSASVLGKTIKLVFRCAPPLHIPLDDGTEVASLQLSFGNLQFSN